MTLKKIASFILCILMMGSLMPFANAEVQPDLADDYFGCEIDVPTALERTRQRLAEDSEKTIAELAAEVGVGIWDFSPYAEEQPPEPQLTVTAEQSWDDVVAALLNKYGIATDRLDDQYDYNVALAYYNTVTGEEHYLYGDRYLVSASMFKIPLNMIYSDRIAAGEMDFDTDIWGLPYKYYQYSTITHSNNDRAKQLMDYLGGYMTFKELQKSYLGDDPFETLGWQYNADNYYTAQEICNCLKMVYNEPERFNGILQNMLQATQYKYFELYERRYPIAHKYGFVSQKEETGEHSYINDCAIVFADAPFIIVMFTDNLPYAYDVMAEYCTLMCDYTNLHATSAPEVLPEAQQLPELGPMPEFIESAELVEKQMKTLADSAIGEGKRMNLLSTMTIVAVLVAAIYCLVLIFRRNGAGGINAFWAIIAILIAAIALILCVIAFNFGTFFAKPKGNPQDTVKEFYSDIISGNYHAAYKHLSDYSSLGLENESDSLESGLLVEALRDSYDFTLNGECKKDRLQATQHVTFRYLNLKELEAAASEKLPLILNDYVQNHDASELYDENNRYLPAVTDEIYLMALKEAVSEAERYYATADYDVHLDYIDGDWYMSTNDDMIRSLLGGTM